MKLVLDMGISPRAVEVLRAGGHDVEHLAQIGLAGLDDQEITDWARDEERAIVTFDRDFLKIAARHNLLLPSIIHLRLPRTTVPEMIRLLVAAVGQYEQELKRGAVVTIRSHRIHCRNLPIHESEE